MARPVACSWITHATRRWFDHCDKCGRRRLVARYYEVYGECPGCDRCREKGREEHILTWWWECTGCLIDTITAIAERDFDALAGEPAP